MSRAWGRGSSNPKPENALKRAEELILVGQKEAALQTLQLVFTGSGRRYRTWAKIYEDIIIRHLELCCEVRNGKYAKEALQQYRNMCQTVNVTSLEEVIKFFMKKAGEKAEEAITASDAAALDIDDLDANATPEDIMLSYVSGEKSKDRTERTMVTPWFRFLWETYRTLLDILRHNSRLQALYALSIKCAFAFCLKYKRMSEFRRLCDLLRNHLANTQRRALYGKDQKDRPDLTIPDTLQLYVETRFEQLKTACELELWQEAFRSVEDIIGLIAINPKIVKPSMMATYYAQLTKIFAFSDNSSLYCAYAWHKLYNLTVSFNKKMTETDSQMLSSSVLLAAMSIRPYEREFIHKEMRFEHNLERKKRMANIMRFGIESKLEGSENYSREALLQEISQPVFLSKVCKEVYSLYELLRADFNPLDLCKSVELLCDKLKGISKPMSPGNPISTIDLSIYAGSLKYIAVLRTLKQLSRVYANMKVEQLGSLVPFMTFGEVEAIIVDAVKHGYLNIRIDHKDDMIHFGEDTLDSEKFHSHLSKITERMGNVMKMIHTNLTDEIALQKEQMIEIARDKIHEEHALALARKEMIEKRKEDQEQIMLEKQRAEELKRREQTEQAKAAEELRRRQEAEKREQERIQREIEEREIEEAKALLEKGKKKLKPGQKLDKKQIMQEVLSEKLKEQQEFDKRLSKLCKHLDHLERAKREEEISYIEIGYKKKMEEEEEFHKQESERMEEENKKAWLLDVEEKHRLEKMEEDYLEFSIQVKNRRHQEFEMKRKEYERALKQRKDEIKKERILQRKLKFIERSKNQIQSQMAEDDERIRKDEERRKEEEKQKKLEEKRRKADEIAEKTRKKELEIEEKLRRDKEEMLKSSSARDRDPMYRERDTDKWTRSSTFHEGQRSPRFGSSRNAYVPPAASASASTSQTSRASGGGYVPPHLRNSGASSNAPPPSSSSNAPSSSMADTGGSGGGGGGGGGAFVPSRLRERYGRQGEEQRSFDSRESMRDTRDSGRDRPDDGWKTVSDKKKDYRSSSSAKYTPPYRSSNQSASQGSGDRYEAPRRDGSRW